MVICKKPILGICRLYFMAQRRHLLARAGVRVRTIDSLNLHYRL